MMKFVTSCIDEKTGYTMVLSEVSYNMAVEWLQKEANKYGKEIYRVESNGADDLQLYVGTPKKHINPMTGYDDVWYIRRAIFHYDESRGYLMQE